jgi:hypothetical protein
MCGIADGWDIHKRKAKTWKSAPGKYSGGAWCWFPVNCKSISPVSFSVPAAGAYRSRATRFLKIKLCKYCKNYIQQQTTSSTSLSVPGTGWVNKDFK